MRPRNTGILLLVAAALAAFVYFYEIRGGEQRLEAAEQAKRLFPGPAAEEIRAIALTTSDGRDARVERHDGGWRLVAPLEFPGDAVALDGVASSLADLASEGVIDDPQPPEVYGLGEDARVVRFSADGGDEYELRIGARTPVGGNTYVSVGGDPRVFTVPTYRVNAFQRELDDLRERRLLRFDRDAIRRIAASWPGGGVVLARRDTDWFLEEPLSARADEDTVETVLSDLAFLRAESFLDDPPAEAVQGLDPPAFRAVLTGEAPEEGGDPPRWELLVGAPQEEGGRVARGAHDALYTIAEERFEDLPRRVVAYRFKELTRLAASDVERIELVFHDAAGEVVSVTARREEEGWTAEPETLDAGVPERLLGQLARLRAEEIEAERMEEGELSGVGLAPPRVVVRAFGEPSEGGEAPKLAELHLGEMDPERGIAARIPQRETIYRLEAGLAEDVPVSLEALRNRFVAQEEPESEAEPEAGLESEAAPES